MSIFEWPVNAGFTVSCKIEMLIFEMALVIKQYVQFAILFVETDTSNIVVLVLVIFLSHYAQGHNIVSPISLKLATL